MKGLVFVHDDLSDGPVLTEVRWLEEFFLVGDLWGKSYHVYKVPLDNPDVEQLRVVWSFAHFGRHSFVVAWVLGLSLMYNSNLKFTM